MTFPLLAALTMAPWLMPQTHLPTFQYGLREMGFQHREGQAGVQRRQDVLGRECPPDGLVSCRKQVVPSAERILIGFSVPSTGTSESRGQKKSPHFSPCATSAHLSILSSFLQAVLFQVESEELCLVCNGEDSVAGGDPSPG